MKRTGFFRQSQVLISRYLKIFFNDKQNLALTLAIPLLTILLVCMVASEDMFACEANNKINDGYPILSWEIVDYEGPKEEGDEEKEEPKVEKWNGEIPQSPQLMPVDSEKKEFYVSNPGDLQFIANAKGEWLEKTYYLNNDMDFDGKEIKPIGDQDNPFKGKFEGNGHIISNFTINAKGNCTGFFGKISGEDCEINNLGIKKAKIKGTDTYENIGIIAGATDKATIEGCYTVDSDIDVKGTNIGSIAGSINGFETTVINCYSRADIKVDGKNTGGIVGSVFDGGVRYTYFAGSLEAKESKDNFGCIVGKLENKDNTLKCVYDNTILTDFNAVGSEEFLDSSLSIEGWKTQKLQQNASLIRSLEKDISEDETNGTFKNDGELADFSGTQTGLFMLACVAIFVGICNSIQEICKERNILKREYMTNLRLSSYMISKLVVQGLICAVQTVLILIIFYISVSNKVFPTNGVLLPSAHLEVFITMFLLTYASDAIALLISSIVKNSSTANTFIPIILIVQIVFSGVLFDLGDFMEKLAGIMISKWGIGALAATSRLNESRLSMLMKNPEMTLKMGEDMTRIKDLYVATASNLVLIWFVLFMFVVVCSVLSGFILTSVKKDRR